MVVMSHLQKISYMKREGIDSDHGLQYERNLFLCVYLRCKRKKREGQLINFIVGNNVKNVGVFDDLVFGLFNNEENIHLGKQLVFVQMKHLAITMKEKPIDKVLFSRRNEKNKKTFFELIFHSIHDLKDSFTKTSSNVVSQIPNTPPASGSSIDISDSLQSLGFCFEDCVFIYYTNARIDKRREDVCEQKFIVSEPPKLIDDILKTSDSYLQDSVVLKLNPSFLKTIIQCKENCSAMKACANNFYIYLNQSDCMEKTIKMEINQYISMSDPHLYLNTIQEIKHHFSENICEFLSDDSHILENIFSYLKLLEYSKNVIEPIKVNCDFFNEDIVELLCKIISNNNITLWKASHDTKLLDIIKYLQVAKKLCEIYPDSIQLVLDTAESVDLWRTARNTKVYKHYEKIFILIGDVFTDVNKIVKSEVNSNEHILILCYDEKIYSNSEYTKYQNTPISKELSEYGTKMILKCAVEFQGLNACIGDICGDFIILNNMKCIISNVLSNTTIKIGCMLPRVNDFYVKRILKYENKTCGEKEFVESLLKRKVTVISGVAGMGKTALLKSFCNEIKLLHRNYWVIFIDLKCHLKALSEIHEEISVHDSVNIIACLALESELERHIFKQCGIDASNVVIFLDGCDIIFQNIQKEFLYLMTALSKSNIISIVISTRPCYEQIFCRKLNVSSTKVLPLTEEEQKRFILSFCERTSEKSLNNAHRDYALNCLFKMLNVNNCNWIAEIPLHLQMIANIFYKEIMPCFVEKSLNVPDLVLYKLFNKSIALLYERCLIKEFEIKYEEREIKFESGVFDRIKRKLYKIDSEIWGAVACNECFEVEISEISFNDDDLVEMCKVGIISNINPCTFIHETIAEFLAAKYLASSIDDICKKGVLKVIWTKIRRGSNYPLFRKFLYLIFMEDKSWKIAQLTAVIF